MGGHRGDDDVAIAQLNVRAGKRQTRLIDDHSLRRLRENRRADSADGDDRQQRANAAIHRSILNLAMILRREKYTGRQRRRKVNRRWSPRVCGDGAAAVRWNPIPATLV